MKFFFFSFTSLFLPLGLRRPALSFLHFLPINYQNIMKNGIGSVALKRRAPELFLQHNYTEKPPFWDQRKSSANPTPLKKSQMDYPYIKKSDTYSENITMINIKKWGRKSVSNMTKKRCMLKYPIKKQRKIFISLGNFPDAKK